MKSYTDKNGRIWTSDGEDFWLCNEDGLQVEEYRTAKNEPIWIAFAPDRGMILKRTTAQAAMDAAGNKQ